MATSEPTVSTGQSMHSFLPVVAASARAFRDVVPRERDRLIDCCYKLGLGWKLVLDAHAMRRLS